MLKMSLIKSKNSKSSGLDDFVFSCSTDVTLHISSYSVTVSSKFGLRQFLSEIKCGHAASDHTPTPLRKFADSSSSGAVHRPSRTQGSRYTFLSCVRLALNAVLREWWTFTKAICLQVKRCGLVKLQSKHSSISAHNSDINWGSWSEDMSNSILKRTTYYNYLLKSY